MHGSHGCTQIRSIRFSCSIKKEKTKCFTPNQQIKSLIHFSKSITQFNVLQQQNIKVYYENQVVGDYFADIIADQVILEIKAAECLRGENKAQLINYLKATDKEVGLLLNFGKTPEFERVIFTNDRKKRFDSEIPNPCGVPRSTRRK